MSPSFELGWAFNLPLNIRDIYNIRGELASSTTSDIIQTITIY